MEQNHFILSSVRTHHSAGSGDKRNCAPRRSRVRQQNQLRFRHTSDDLFSAETLSSLRGCRRSWESAYSRERAQDITDIFESQHYSQPAHNPGSNRFIATSDSIMEQVNGCCPVCGTRKELPHYRFSSSLTKARFFFHQTTYLVYALRRSGHQGSRLSNLKIGLDVARLPSILFHCPHEIMTSTFSWNDI